MKHQFFGNVDSPLFGVHHPPRGIAKKTVRAVMICPPIGQEYIRTHWCLRLMANQLARNGCHVLRMDYHGIGDSAGDLGDITSTAQWIDNIKTGIDHLKQLSGAGTVMLAGLRFGAALAAEVAQTRNDVNALVCWEPTLDGQEYLDELRVMHQRMLDLWVCKMSTPDNEQSEEMLGSRFQRTLVQEIEQAKVRLDKVVQPQLIVIPSKPIVNFVHPEHAIQKVVSTEDEYNWAELRSLETAWLRSQTARVIVKSIAEMFVRLEKFNAVSSPALVEIEQHASLDISATTIPSTGVLS